MQLYIFTKKIKIELLKKKYHIMFFYIYLQPKTKQEHHIQYECCSVRGHQDLVKKGNNSKTIAFRIMPLVLQLHLVMMSKYSQFDVETIYTFLVMGYIKVFCMTMTTTTTITI